MKVDYDLIKALLGKVESCKDVHGLSADELRIDGIDNEVISWHIDMLYDKKFLYVDKYSTIGVPKLLNYYNVKFTIDGYDFYTAIKDETVWQKIKAFIKHKGLELSFESIKCAIPFVLNEIFGINQFK